MSVRVSRDQCSFNSSTGLFAVFHALRRRLAPRHPPHALSSLTALTSRSHQTFTLAGSEPNGRERPLAEGYRPRLHRPGDGNDPSLVALLSGSQKRTSLTRSRASSLKGARLPRTLCVQLFRSTCLSKNPDDGLPRHLS